MKTYGQIKYVADEKAWAIKAPPHVSMRLKRVFERIDKRNHVNLLLSNTDENCRELLWFLERFPLEFVEASDRKLLKAGATAHLQRERLIEEVLGAGYQAPGFKLALPPREHQSVAADLLLRSGRLLLADELGVGKTVSAIAPLTDARTLPALVVVPAHLQKQWQAEINRFAPALRIHIIKKGSYYDVTKARGKSLPFPDVFICTYSKLSGWAEYLAGVIKYIVFEECQELRRADASHGRTRKYAAAEFLAARCQFCIGMSATPIYNLGGEIFHVLNVIAPGQLGSEEEFCREWCKSTRRAKEAVVQDPKALGLYLRERGLMLRRSRKDVKRETPGLSIVPHIIDADLKALDAISARTAELAKIILTQGGQARGEKLRASEEFSNLLRQTTGIAKAPYVAEFVRMLVESGEQILLFGWHRAVYDIWKDALKDLNPVFYTGEESPSQKEASKRAFVEGRARILVISNRSGSGLDGLQFVCRTTVHGELDWTPSVHEQCDGRVDRDGQEDPVVAYYLIAETGADPTICDVLGLKKQQSGGIRDPHADLVETIVDEDHIKKLAEGYLAQRGIAAPVSEQISEVA